MNYKVIWDRGAFRKLVLLWRASGEPARAIQAFDRIEQLLSVDAELQGESRARKKTNAGF